ncbi:PKD-like family lipoprotein [Pedobacter montanisoli]|uniref:PKD-like family lipoprotein n=1 Tax=Pedobacter montanisoli TaxID=2923277 RepID=A0ABS9ZV81_9SPHI|nr:PKD-like family lipoprotein [Pedobacter montanisoli]MCJ0741104.1 PKD-like family lipoprotein [Pedobacter montanisoli]
MKRIYISLIALVALLSSCAKDHSNYDYRPKENITVKGMETSYTVISEKDNLVINPEVSSTDASAQFEYLWGIYETNVQGAVPVLDTLAKTKNLNYAVKKPAKGWVLVYRVTNKNTKYSQYFTSSINIVTEFTRGWYVAKDDGAQADLDLFLTPTNIIPESKKENIYSAVNGAKLAGQAQLLSYYTGYKSDVTGVLGNTKTLVLSTSKDVSTIYINTLKKIRTLDNAFFETPATRGPCYAFLGSSAYYLINGGQVHAISNSSLNVGIFGGRFLRDANNSPYSLSKYFMANWLTNAYMYDETSSSFVALSQGYGTSLTSVTDDAGTAMPAANTNKKLIYMGIKNTTYLPAPAYRYALMGCAIFQDKNNPAVKTISEIYADEFRMKFTNTPINATEQAYNGTNFTVPYAQENILYFSVNGNQIWSRNLSNNFEKLEYTLPAGEEVTFIRHKAYSSEAPYTYNFIMIASQTGGNYKIRMFNKASGSITGGPMVTLEGTGIAKDVLYITPSVGEGTYTTQW